MKILILEDEPEIARMIADSCRAFEGTEPEIFHTLEPARAFLDEKKVDLLFLDLNLNGEDGFQILGEATAESFHTIIISAYTDRAAEAFAYGVLDFIAKPFTPERIHQALERYRHGLESQLRTLRYVAAYEEDRIHLYELKQIDYFQAEGKYCRFFMKERGKDLRKSLS